MGDARAAARRHSQKGRAVTVAERPSGRPIALTIAGSDSSGGAGIQADLKTFGAFGVYGASAITALTAQNTRGVQGVEAVSAAFVVAQIESVLSDLNVRAIKTGMLANRAIVEAVAQRLAAVPEIPVVVDPVIIATSGDALLTSDAIDAVIQALLPHAALITPNLAEAARLLGVAQAQSESDMADQAKALHAQGGRPVLLKGGHSIAADATDILFDGLTITRFSGPRIATPHTHGTGCTLSAAIAAGLACAQPLPVAIQAAKAYVTRGLLAGRALGVGHGSGPLDHLV
jgi:hydroxymethylpyrimidine/phosphomethylpyrimidine kinase